MENKGKIEENSREERNPYLVPLVSRLAALPFFMAAYVIWFRHTPYKSFIYMMIATITLTMTPYLTRFFRYRKWKKNHPGLEFDQNYFETEDAVDRHTYRKR